MNKSIQVVITSILLIAAFFTAALSFDACTRKKKNVQDSVDEALEQVTDDEFFEDDLTDDGSYESDETSTTDFSDDSNLSSVDYSDAADKSNSDDSAEEESNTSYQESNTYANTSNTTGKYMVVAGNFLVESNANKMMRRLNNLGYNSSEVANFDYSQYYTVIASRTNDYSAAQSLASALKGEGIDCYVHTRK